MNYKDKLKKMRATIPLTDEVVCPDCKVSYYDEFNLISLAALKFCLLCANRNLDKQTIEEKYHVNK
jgi:hypothetical protein